MGRTAMAMLGALAATAAITVMVAVSPVLGATAEDHTTEMVVGQARLQALVGQGARERNPALVARAEQQFECWLIDQEESPPTDLHFDCRAGFLAALGQLQRSEDGRQETAAR